MRPTPIPVLLCFLAGAIVIAVAPRFASQGVTGSIEGTVTQVGSTAPVGGAQIFLAGGANPGITALEAQDLLNRRAAEGIVGSADLLEVAQKGLPNFYTTNGLARGIRPVTTTDAMGRFVIPNLAPGPYAVSADFGGDFLPVQDGLPSRYVTSAVTVRAQQRQAVSLSLVPGASVSGRVIYSTRIPVGRMGIQLFTVMDTIEGKTFRIYNPGFFDSGYGTSGGQYRINNLPPGEYIVATDPALNPDGVIVIDPNRAPVLPTPGSAISVRTFYPSAFDASTATSFTLKAGEDVRGIDIQIREGTVRKISGRVINNLPRVPQLSLGGTAIEDLLDLIGGRSPAGPRPQAADADTALMALIPRRPDPLSPLPILNTPRADFTNGGQFEILGGIPSGTYDLFASIQDYPGFGPQDPSVQRWSFGTTSLVVGVDNLDGVVVEVRRGIDLKGQVTLDGNSFSATDVRVALEPDDSASQFSLIADAARSRRPVSGNGSFEIPFVPEGRYRVQFGTPRVGGRYSPLPPLVPIPNTYVEDIRQGSVSVYDNGIQVGRTPVEPLEIVLKSNGASIEGIARNAAGNPLYGVTIVLVPAPQRRQNFDLYKRVISDYSGHFAIADLPPGDYKLFAWEENIERAFEKPTFLAKYESLGRLLTFAAGSKLTVDPIVIPKR